MKTLAVSPITGAVKLGTLNKARNAFSGKTEDMTSQFLRCVIERAEYEKGSFDITSGDRKWVVTVQQVRK